MTRQCKLVSADGRLEVPPERWAHRVPSNNFLGLRAGHAAGTSTNSNWRTTCRTN